MKVTNYLTYRNLKYSFEHIKKKKQEHYPNQNINRTSVVQFVQL